MYTVIITRTRPSKSVQWYYETTSESGYETIKNNVAGQMKTTSANGLVQTITQQWNRAEDFKALVVNKGDSAWAKHSTLQKNYMAENNITSEIFTSGTAGDVTRRFNPSTKEFEIV